MSPALIVVERTAPNRWVASAAGTPLWSAGPSKEHAVGDLVLRTGWQIGVASVVDRTHAAGFCAVPRPGVRAVRAPLPQEDLP